MDRTLTTFSATKDAELALNLERQAEEQVLAGEVEAAADLYDRALRLRIDGRCPDVFLTAEALARTSNEACCQLSGSRERLLQAERRLQRTLSMLDEILDAQSGVGPSAAPLVSGVHLTLSNLAALHLRAGRKEMALKLLKEAEELGPSIPAAEAAATQLSLCALLSGLRRHIEAERHASEAISLGEADIFQLQNSSETSAPLLQDKASTLAVAYNNLAVQREYLGCSDCLALYEKAVVLAEGYMSKDSQLLARLRDSHRTALQTVVERRATASSNRHLSVGSGATVNRRPSSAIEARGVVHVEANRRPSSAIAARGPGKRAESAEAGRRRPASAARARDGRWDSEVTRPQVRRDSSSSRGAVPSKDRSLLSRELAKLLKPEAQEQASEAASWLPKEKARLPKIQWHESSATSASSSVEDAMNPLPTPALPSHMRFALHQVEAAKPEGTANQTPSPGKAEETREAPGGQGASPEPALSRQSSKTRRDSGSVFDGRLGAELQRALDFGRCEAARRIQRAYRQHRRLQMVLAQAEQARSRRAETTATAASGAGPPQASSATAATNLPRPSIPGRMPRPRGAADRDLQGLPRRSLPNLGTQVGPAVASQQQTRREGALPRDCTALDCREEAPEALRRRRAAAAGTIQVTWKRHRRRLRSWAVLVLQRWARKLLTQQRKEAAQKAEEERAAEKAKKMEEERLAKEAAEAAAKAEEERAAKEAAEKAEAEKATKAEEEHIAKEAAEAAAKAEEERAAKEAVEKAKKMEEERVAQEAADAAAKAEEERAAKEAAEEAEAEKAKKMEEERVAQEAADAAAKAQEERAAKEAAEKAEAEKAKEMEEERVAQEAAEAAAKAQEERAAKEAAEKAEAEKAKKMEEERVAQEAAAKAEEEHAAKEAAEKAEAEKATKAEEERIAKEAAEAAAKAEEEPAAKEAAEKAEAENATKAEEESIAKEAAEDAGKAEAEKAKERLAKEAAEALVNAVAKEAAEAAVKAEEQRFADEAAKAGVAKETADAAKATKLEEEFLANQAPETAEPENATAAEELKAQAAGEVEDQNEADGLAKGDQADSAKDEREFLAAEAKQDEEECLAKEAVDVLAKADWEQLAMEATDDASAEAQIQQLLEAAVEAAQAKSLEEQEDAAGLSKADPEEELISKTKEPQERQMPLSQVVADTPDAAQDQQPIKAKVEVETDRFPERQRQACMPEEAEQGVVVAREAETVPTETSANAGGSTEMQPAEPNPRGFEELRAEQQPIPAEAEARLLVENTSVESCDEKEPLAEPSAADETTQRLEALEKAIDKEVDRISVRTDDASTEDEGEALLLPECEAWSCAQCGLINEVCPDICVLCEATRSPSRRRGSLAQLASSGAARSKAPPPMRHGPVRR